MTGEIDEQRLTIATAMHDFLEAHEINNGSSQTIDNFTMVLNAFAEWLKSTHNVLYVDELTIKLLRGYVAYLQKRPSMRGYPLSDATVHHYALVVSVFCHWLEKEEIIVKPITTRFQLPKMEQKEIPALTYEDFERLLEACEYGDKRKPRLLKALTSRNKAIVSVLFDAGIRRGELAGLRLGDVDRDLRLLYVKRKGNKWQQVPISQQGFKPLHEYITKHRPYLAALGSGMGSKKTDPVFISYKGEALTGRAVGRLFETLRKRAGIDDKPVRSHQGRRFMATTQLAAGRSPLDVQRQMGHSTLTMTNRYASLTVEHIKKSHEMYSPLRNTASDNRSTFGSGYGED